QQSAGLPSFYPAKRIEAPSIRRLLDQHREPSLPRLLTLRARHPACHLAAVAGRLLLVERPRRLVLLEVSHHPVGQCPVGGRRVAAVGMHILVREGRESARPPATFRDRPICELEISLAPDALRMPRRATTHVALAVDRLPNPVDPAE